MDHLQGALSADLTRRGVDPEVLSELGERGETRRLPERTELLLQVGRRAALHPSLLTDADFAKLRRRGVDDAELAEVIALAGALSFLVTTSRACGDAASEPEPERG